MRRIQNDIDWERLDRIETESGETSRQKLKYLDARKWFRVAWMDACRLGLDAPPTVRMLDLGTGPGYFPYVCRLLGHDVQALDVPDRNLYARVCECLGVDVIPHRVLARAPLPDFPHRFDLVTAFRLGFNIKPGRPGSTLFGLDDWDFFLDDVRDRVLERSGRLVMKMVNQQDCAGPKFEDPELVALFEHRGGRVQQAERTIVFDPLS